MIYYMFANVEKNREIQTNFSKDVFQKIIQYVFKILVKHRAYFLYNILIMSKQHNDTIPLFLAHLHKILTNQTYQQIIKWDQHRQGFIIIDKTKLTQQILPYYYRHHKYCSFVRQLNMYGFKKARSKNDQAFFFNQQFSIAMFQELKNIKRKVTFKKSNKQNIETFQSLNNHKQVRFDSSIEIAKIQEIKQFDPIQQSSKKHKIDQQKYADIYGNYAKSSKKMLQSLKLICNLEPLSALSIEQQIKEPLRYEYCQSMKLLESNKFLQRNQSIREQLEELIKFQ